MFAECLNGFCTCKPNAVGKSCDECTDGYFGLSETNPDGCSECWCAGVTTDCQEASLHWSEVVLARGQDHGLKVTDRFAHSACSMSRSFHESLMMNSFFVVFPG